MEVSPPGTRERRAFTAIMPMRPSANTYRFSIPAKILFGSGLQEDFQRAAAEGHIGE